MVDIDVPGHDYRMHHFNEPLESHSLHFIHKEPDGQGGFNTVRDGTTNEAVIEVLIDRIQFLNKKHSSPFNEHALQHLQLALDALHRRTAERVKRGVEGTGKD